MDSFIQSIEHSLMQPLPGEKAHEAMMHSLKRLNPRPPGPDARKAGVLLLLYPEASAWNTIFIRRKSKIRSDAHSGQIGFPGGKEEPGDLTLEHTAIRETEEEIGVAASRISILGALSELFIPVSNFRVFPFVGYTKEKPEFILQEEEVEGILTIDVETLLMPSIRGVTEIRTNAGLMLSEVPYFDLKGNILWGATAMIVNEFLTVVQQIKPAGFWGPGNS